MKNLEKLFFQLIFRHFLFGMNKGLKSLGLGPYYNLVNLPDILHFRKLLLISRSSMMMRLMLRLLQPKKGTIFRKDLKRLITHMCSPVYFSFKPRSCYFERFAEIKVDPSCLINHIKFFPNSERNVLILLVSTMSIDGSVKSFPIYKQSDGWTIFLNLETNETKCFGGSKLTQNESLICAKQGEYSAHTGNNLMNNNVVYVTFRSIRRLILAHFSKVNAIAFHPSLPLMVTYDDGVKHAKFWYIPSELCSDPVLISILNFPDLIVFSIAFHPVLPIVFFGGTNGTIQAWRAISQ